MNHLYFWGIIDSPQAGRGAGRGMISGTSLEAMSVINIQESFLNIALATGKHTTVHLLNGAKISGHVRSFDKYSIVLETISQEQLIFKHSVSAVLICCKNKHCSEDCRPNSSTVERPKTA